MDIDLILHDAIQSVMSGVSGAFDLLNRFPTTWLTLIISITFFCYICRMLIAPLFGASFQRGTDSTRKVDVDDD